MLRMWHIGLSIRGTSSECAPCHLAVKKLSALCQADNDQSERSKNRFRFEQVMTMAGEPCHNQVCDNNRAGAGARHRGGGVP